LQTGKLISDISGIAMKAKMTVTKLELRKIKLMQDTGRVGHNFELVAKVRVQPRTMGALSGEGIDCPELQ
jgi:hypothetical protein